MTDNKSREDNVAGTDNYPGRVDDIFDADALEELRKKYGVYDDGAEETVKKSSKAANGSSDFITPEKLPLVPSFPKENKVYPFDTVASSHTGFPVSKTSTMSSGQENKKMPKKTDSGAADKKGKGIGEVIRKIILTVAILTMIVCVGILSNMYFIGPYMGKRDIQKAVDAKSDSVTPKDWTQIKNKYPDVKFPAGMQLEYAELYVLNPDLAGWLEVAGAGIDLPVVQGDNNDAYLKTTFYGEKSKYGCLFLDSDNNIKELDRNSVIYGHNMSYDDLMFGKLEAYKKIDGFKAAPLIEFNTLYTNYKWKIYAVFITNGLKSGDKNGYVFNYIFKNLGSDEIFKTYIAQVDQRKLYTTGVDILPSDRLLTLSTCCYDFDDARLVVVARMVREGESPNVETGKVATNENPRYPQAWYNAKGQKNPYKNEEQWLPR